MERVYSKIEKTKNCWIWKGTINSQGYGVAWFNGKLHRAHRLIYEWERETIPQGMVADHICRIRNCVNPDHIEIITNGANVLRGVSQSAVNSRKKFCIRGHKFTPENTYSYTRGWRCCKTCFNARNRRVRALKKQAMLTDKERTS